MKVFWGSGGAAELLCTLFHDSDVRINSGFPLCRPQKTGEIAVAAGAGYFFIMFQLRVQYPPTAAQGATP